MVSDPWLAERPNAVPSHPTEPPDRVFRYCGFGRRLMAVLADSALFFVVTTPLLFIVTGGQLARFSDLLAERPGLAVLANDLLPLVLVLLFWVRFGATPGKQLMDCRVVLVATGEPPGWSRALLRYIGYFVSLLTLGLGFLWILWDPRRQGFHDKIAGTVVIDSFILTQGDAGKSLEQLAKEASA